MYLRYILNTLLTRSKGYAFIWNKPKILNWADHKARPVIAAGLNRHCSLMDPECFLKADLTTNASESGHHQVNTTGRYLTLLGAVMKYD